MASGKIIGFDFIVIFSFLFGLLVLSTAVLSPQVHRQPTWYGLLAPALIYDIMFEIGMGYQTDAGPPAGLCTFQAVLLYSIPGWAVVALGCFIITFHCELKYNIETEENEAIPRVLSRRAKLLLIFIPLLSFLAFLLLNALTVILDPRRPNATLNHYKLYCTPKTHTGLRVGGAIIGVGMFIWIFIIVKVGYLLKIHYSKLRERGNAIFHQVFSIYIRVTALSVAASLVITLYIWSYATDSADNILASYCLCLPGVIIFSVFGTQRDIMKSWAFWRAFSRPAYGFGAQTSSSFGQIEITTVGMGEVKQTGIWKNIGYNWNIGTKALMTTSNSP